MLGALLGSLRAPGGANGETGWVHSGRADSGHLMRGRHMASFDVRGRSRFSLRIIGRLVLMLVAVSAGLISPTAVPAVGAQQAPGQQVATSGSISVLWGDSLPGRGNIRVTELLLHDDRGPTIPVTVDQRLTHPFGGPLGLDRKRVKVTGVLRASAARGAAGSRAAAPAQALVLEVQSIELDQQPQASVAAAAGGWPGRRSS
jgi:hypothetical protein